VTHIDDISRLLVFEHLEQVVLVGHSYGGMVITGVAGRVPERIGHLVYLDAFWPDPGQAAFDVLPALAAALGDPPSGRALERSHGRMVGGGAVPAHRGPSAGACRCPSLDRGRAVWAVHPAGLHRGRPGGRSLIHTKRRAMSVTTIDVETIVAQALDDLKARRIEVPTAERLVATIAWHSSARSAEECRHVPRRSGLLGRGSGADRREMSAGSDCDRTILRQVSAAGGLDLEADVFTVGLVAIWLGDSSWPVSATTFQGRS
jgi:pimeloyl-ACP methyl ester carboxylesterase